MQPRLQEGDVVVVKEQEDVESGQVVIVCLNGDEYTIKSWDKRSCHTVSWEFININRFNRNVKKYKNNNELKKDEYIGSIGGLEKDELIIDVEQGDYIYINYNNVVDKGLGTLKIKMEY